MWNNFGAVSAVREWTTADYRQLESGKVRGDNKLVERRYFMLKSLDLNAGHYEAMSKKKIKV